MTLLSFMMDQGVTRPPASPELAMAGRPLEHCIILLFEG